MKASMIHLLCGIPVLLLAVGCGRQQTAGDGTPRLGYVKSPLAAPLFVAEPGAFTPVEFGSGGDVGYALLAGDIAAGLVEPAKAAALFKLADNLRAAGAITFPYGTTLILRGDLALRLGELGGRAVAVRDPRCGLLHQFQADAGRLGVETGTMRFLPMPFDSMVPALEAGKADAILTRGGHALLAVAAGHKVLYQSWETVGADECCPQTLAQIELVLVVRSDLGEAPLHALVEALETAGSVLSPTVRRVVGERTGIPESTLESFPVPSFAVLSPEQQLELTGKADIPAVGTSGHRHGHNHGHECGPACGHDEPRSR